VDVCVFKSELEPCSPMGQANSLFSPDRFPHLIYKQMYHISTASAHVTQPCCDQHVMKHQSSL